MTIIKTLFYKKGYSISHKRGIWGHILKYLWIFFIEFFTYPFNDYNKNPIL